MPLRRASWQPTRHWARSLPSRMVTCDLPPPPPPATWTILTTPVTFPPSMAGRQLPPSLQSVALLRRVRLAPPSPRLCCCSPQQCPALWRTSSTTLRIPCPPRAPAFPRWGCAGPRRCPPAAAGRSARPPRRCWNAGSRSVPTMGWPLVAREDVRFALGLENQSWDSVWRLLLLGVVDAVVSFPGVIGWKGGLTGG